MVQDTATSINVGLNPGGTGKEALQAKSKREKVIFVSGKS